MKSFITMKTVPKHMKNLTAVRFFGLQLSYDLVNTSRIYLE